MGRCLFCAERGLDTLKIMILDDIWAARKRGDFAHARELQQALKDYATTRRQSRAAMSS